MSIILDGTNGISSPVFTITSTVASTSTNPSTEFEKHPLCKNFHISQYKH